MRCPIGEPQPDFCGIQARRFLERRERVFLTHEARVHGREQDPIAGVLALHFEQALHGRLGLEKSALRQQGLRKAAPGERQMGRLFLRVLQQANRVLRATRREGYRSQAAERCHVRRVGTQDIPKNRLGRFVLVRRERLSCLLDAANLRVRQPGAFVGIKRVRIFLELDQHVAVGEPGALQKRCCGNDPLEFLASLLEPLGSAVRAGQVGACLPEIGAQANCALQNFDRLGHLALIEQRRTQQMQAVHLTGSRGLDGA